MDWKPLIIGTAVGAGDTAIGHYLSPTALAGHKYLLYRAGTFAIGLWGDWSGKLSPDIAYSLMTAASSLIAQDVPYALTGGGFKAFGAVDGGSEHRLVEVVATTEEPRPTWNRPQRIALGTNPATAVG